MKNNILARLQRLEQQIRRVDGVIVVEQLANGYRLPGGEIVQTIDELNRRYSVVIVDDISILFSAH